MKRLIRCFVFSWHDTMKERPNEFVEDDKSFPLTISNNVGGKQGSTMWNNAKRYEGFESLDKDKKNTRRTKWSVFE